MEIEGKNNKNKDRFSYNKCIKEVLKPFFLSLNPKRGTPSPFYLMDLAYFTKFTDVKSIKKLFRFFSIPL